MNDRNPKTDPRKPAEIRNSTILEFQRQERHCNNFCQRTFCSENQARSVESIQLGDSTRLSKYFTHNGIKLDLTRESFLMAKKRFLNQKTEKKMII